MLINLSTDYALIKVNGQQAEKLLQGQLTCDVREVNATQSRLSAYCDSKGRMLTSLRLIWFQDHYYLLLPIDMVEQTLAHLKKYAVFSKVTFEDDNENLAVLGYIGEPSAELANEITIEFPREIDLVTHNEALLTVRLSNAPSRFIVLVDKHYLDKLSLPIVNDQNAWQLADIAAGIAQIYPATSSLFTPHMLNYQNLNAIGFNKGCYVGQEVIARTHYLGQAKRSLQRLQFESLPKPEIGEKLFNEAQQEIGILVEIAQRSPHLFNALAVIQNDALTNGIYFKHTLAKLY